MKTRISNSWLFVMVLAVASATSGCAQDGVNSPVPASTSDAGKATASAPNGNAAAQPPSAAAGGSPIVVNNDSGAQEPFELDDSYYPPQQPQSIGPVREPYPVKLNNPIILLTVPTLTVPCW